MIRYAAPLLLGLAVGCPLLRSQAQTETKRNDRVVTGKITAQDGHSVAGAKVMFGPHQGGLIFTDEATVTTNAEGAYCGTCASFPGRRTRFGSSC